MALGKTNWTLTTDAFEQLLSRFDSDRDRAGRKYETTRRKLLEFFEARGSRKPDEEADETLNRVARKIAEGENIENIDKYCYGVAKLLWLEVCRQKNKDPVALDDNFPPPAAPPQTDEDEQTRIRLESENRLDCLDECLRKLPPEARDFIIEYYREERGHKIEKRKQQAARLKTTLNGLRLRASRLRRELGACIRSCVSRSGHDR